MFAIVVVESSIQSSVYAFALDDSTKRVSNFISTKRHNVLFIDSLWI